MTKLTPPAPVPSWIVTPDVGLQINSVAVSDDGNCCVFGTSNEFGTGQFAVYCRDGAGNVRWSSQVGAAGSTQGVFWVAASADGQFAAAGGETSKTVGFLTAYRVADGLQVLNVATSYRINQVVLSGDGSLLLAVFEDTVQLYKYADGAYVLASQQTFTGSYCNSCALSPDGFTAAVSCTIYSDSGGASTGQVITLAVDNQKLSVTGAWASEVAVMRVAIAATGNYWGASLHDGSCVLFDQGNVTEPVWRYQPDQANLGTAYGFAITETAEGRVVLACGANLAAVAPAPAGGYLYLVESVQDGSAQAPQFCWGSTLQYSANPGVSLDREAQFVTATDGEPNGENETPGHFYLFDGASGASLWTYATPVMNWPMVITPDGTHVFGGSDDGSVYFWGPATA
jgi:WD40 repeat protein